MDPDPISWCIGTASTHDHSAANVHAASAELERLRRVEGAAAALVEAGLIVADPGQFDALLDALRTSPRSDA